MSSRATIAVVTGTRAEFGLLRSTMRAVDAHEGLSLRVIVAGAHFLTPAETWREVEAEFEIAARVEMQRNADPRDRAHDAIALGRGVEGFARAFEGVRADCVVVLGDRIEAFAAASAGSVMGVPVAHLHGGDRAEGVADEAMRHATTKLAHLHFPATETSAARIVRMGEDESRVFAVGSPAVDGLDEIAPMTNARHAEFGSPEIILALHPIGRSNNDEAHDAAEILAGLAGLRVLALMPNHDAGREGIASALRGSSARVVEHLPRDEFVALCVRMAREGGVIVGNSSAGLIECAAITPCLPCVNIGTRQAGRERPASVVDCETARAETVRAGVDRARAIGRRSVSHPYGDGRAGARVADRLASLGLSDARTRGSLVRKRNAY